MNAPDLLLNLNISDILDEFGVRSNLDKYFNALMSENNKINLVSRETKREDFDRLAADSLIPLKVIRKSIDSYLDIGSGGGFPAVPLLLARPMEKNAVLVERTEKKSVALKRILDSLEIKAEVLSQTFEEITLNYTFDLITLRYVKLTPALLKKIIPYISKSGEFVYYSKPDFEIDGIESFAYSLKDDSVTKSFTVFKNN